MKKFYFFLAFLFFGFSNSQNNRSSDYYDIKKNYEKYPENDSRAFPFVTQYIALAKKNKDHSQLVQAYKDAVYFSASETTKIKYADSTILSALITKNNDLISDAYLGKGIIYYFNYKSTNLRWMSI